MPTNDYFVPDIEFEDSGMRGPQGVSGDAPSLHVEEAAPYLYRVENRELDYDAAEAFVRKHYPEADAGCSMIAKNGLIGHNYDAGYDETAEFAVRVGAHHGHRGSIGMALMPGILTAEVVNDKASNELREEAYDVLPFFVVDGVNDAGVGVAMNRMPGEVAHTKPSDDSGMCVLFAARYVLDYAKSVDEAISLLENKAFWFPENDAIKLCFYLTIYDGKRAVVTDLCGNFTEFGENEPIILTNFRKNNGVDFETYANGIERYDLLAEMYPDTVTEEDMLDTLKVVRYTGAYSQPWYSDFNGDWTELGYGTLTVDSAEADYAEVMSYFRGLYANRVRDGQTKQTLHTVVYDLAKHTMSVMAQEQDKVYRFCIDTMTMIADEIERAKAAELALHDEMYDEFYTQSEIDAQLDDLISDIMAAVADGLAQKVDKPEKEGEDGQILMKDENGTTWHNIPGYLPEVTAEDDGKVMAVENGEWVLTDRFADYIHYVNITVSIGSDNGGVPNGGLTVTIYDADTGDTIASERYNGQPVTFRVPRGMRFIVRQTGTWEGYHNPTPEYIEAAATNDMTLVFTYEVITIPETLRQLQIIVDGGNASSMAAYTGLQFDDTYTENGVEYPIIWDLKHVGTVYDQNGNAHTGVYLAYHNPAPTALPYDAPEREEVDLAVEKVAQEGVYYYGLSGTTYRLLTLNAGDALPTTYDAIYKNAYRSADASILRRGLARYEECVPRKWMLSYGDVGEWWTKTHVGDAKPDQADQIPGFKRGCSAQILSMVKPVRIATGVQTTGELGYTYDDFFIQSCEEMYGMNTIAGEGEAWQDWIDATGLQAPSNDANSGRRIFPSDGAVAQEVGLRSVNTSYQYITWTVKPTGELDGYVNASVARRYTPCCVIYK